jgi:hypothetical protein
MFSTNELLMKKPWKTFTRLVFLKLTMESFKYHTWKCEKGVERLSSSLGVP